MPKPKQHYDPHPIVLDRRARTAEMALVNTGTLSP